MFIKTFNVFAITISILVFVLSFSSSSLRLTDIKSLYNYSLNSEIVKK